MRAVALPAERGSIFDRNGEDLALTVPQQTIWADPRLIADPARAVALLAPVLGGDPAALTDRLARDADFVYVARQIDDMAARGVAGLHLDGVFLLDEPGRASPAGELARPSSGGSTSTTSGVSGLEGQYDARLTGVPGRLVLERDREGGRSPAGARASSRRCRATTSCSPSTARCSTRPSGPCCAK